MTLKEKIENDVIVALKGGNHARTSTLRMLRAAIHNLEIEEKGKSGGEDVSLDDEKIAHVVMKEIKKRKEAIDVYKKGDRKELAEKEEAELAVLEEYAPSQMSEDEIVKVVDKTIADVEPSGPADFGKVMGGVMGQLKGKADASVVSKIVKKKLEGVGG